MREKQRCEVQKLIKELLEIPDSEEKQTEIFLEISRISPDPEWSNYVFGGSDYYDEDDNLNLEAVMDKIFSYKPIIL